MTILNIIGWSLYIPVVVYGLWAICTGRPALGTDYWVGMIGMVIGALLILI